MRLVFLSVALMLVCAAPAAADSLVYVKDSNVWAARSDGSGAVRMTADGTPADRYGDVTQADDGTMLAVRGSRFHRFDRTGRRVATFGSVLTDQPGALGAVGPFDARISPDGQKVAYWLGIMGGWYDYAHGIYYSHPDSAVVYQSAVDGAQLGDTVFWEEPSWLADSQHLLIWERLNGLTPQVASGEIGADHNHFTGWFRDRDTFADPAGGHEIGAGELSRDGQRLAALRSGGTSGLHHAYNQVIVYNVAGLNRAPAPMACAFQGDGGQEMGAPTFSPDGTRIAWAESSGIWIGTIGRPDSCDGWDAKLVVPGGLEPDWGPADPGPGAAAAGATPPTGGATPTTSAPASPQRTAAPTMAVRGSLRRGQLRRGLHFRLTCPAACTVDAELRQGHRVLAHRRFTHAGRLTLHPRAVRPGRLRLSLKITSAGQSPVKLTQTIRVR
jgi:hypothetical protein